MDGWMDRQRFEQQGRQTDRLVDRRRDRYMTMEIGLTHGQTKDKADNNQGSVLLMQKRQQRMCTGVSCSDCSGQSKWNMAHKT